MNAVRSLLVPLVVLSLTAPLLAGELGDKAPPLTIKEWVKGKPVDVTTADGKNVYVVEFWATTCLPCRVSIPHLTELQKEFKGRNVTFIGISTDDEKTVGNVKSFVKDMGEKMDYTVAIDKDGATSKAYMDANYIDGIPHAFIVDQQGRIVWHQNPHPSVPGFEETLEQVVAGKFDLAAARKRMAPLQEQRRKEWTQHEYMREYFRLVQSTGNDAQAAELGRKIVEVARNDATLMNWLAWDILTKEGVVSRDLKLALTAAEAANKATNGANPAVLDTYALALFENGRKKEAVKFQTTAVELARKNGMPDEMIAELSERLERFRKEAD
jgi:thiol-disulfide isomerase/thioredoxin